MESPPPDGPPQAPVWPFLISGKWLLWHLTTVAGAAGMLWLGDWQYRRAAGGNGLSWAYTFEWPLFAGFAVVFWVKTVRDEFRIRRAGLDPDLAENGAEAGVQLPAGLGIEQAGSYLGGAPGDARWSGTAGSEPVLANAWRMDVLRAAAQWAADPELAAYNLQLARLNAATSAVQPRAVQPRAGEPAGGGQAQAIPPLAGNGPAAINGQEGPAR
jgi:hypothetical protein